MWTYYQYGGEALLSLGVTVGATIGAGLGSLVSLVYASGEPPPSMEETVARLERVRDSMAQRERSLWGTMESHRARAIEYAQQKKIREAKMQIRLRMLYDSQIARSQQTLTVIESHLLAIQSAVMNKEVFLALNAGSKALGGRSSLDKVDEVMEALDEQHDTTREMMDIIQHTQTGADASTLDDDAIENELAALMGTADQGGGGEDLLQLPVAPSGPLPTVVVEAAKEETESAANAF